MSDSNLISVFGSTGFIGNHFKKMYRGEVFCCSRETNKPCLNTDILYLISTTHNYHVFDAPLLDIKTNLTKLIKVLEEFKEQCPNNVFNFVSSWFVYGDTDFPAREDSVTNPKGFYSITKQAAERLVMSYCETFNLDYRILRLSNVYGEGATGVSKKRNALQFLAGQIIKGEEISLYNNGEDIRDFMHVEDVCRAIKICMESSLKNQTINIGSGIPQPIGPLMKYVKKKVDSSSKIGNVEPPDFHKKVQVKNMYLDTSLLKTLQFKQEIGIYKGMDRIISKELS